MDRWVGSSWKLPAQSGALLGLSYYVPTVVFNLVAFVPLLYWLEHHERAGRYTWLRAGLVLGLTAHLFTCHFLLALSRFSWLAVLLYLGVALGLALKICVVVGLLGWLRRGTGLPWSWLLVVCWLPMEWLFTFGDLRLTADHLYHGMTSFPFVIQFADLLGPYGVSLFVLAVNGLWYEATIQRRRGSALVLALLLAAVLGYDALAWTRGSGSGEKPFASRWSTQHSPDGQVGRPDRRRAVGGAEQADPGCGRAGRGDRRLAGDGAAVDPLSLAERPESYAVHDVQTLARGLGVSVLFGVEYVRARAEDDWELYNAAMFVDDRGRLDPNWVAKVYLVPFTEQLPFRRIFGPLIEGRGGGWHWLSAAVSLQAPRPRYWKRTKAESARWSATTQLFADLSRGLRLAGAELQVVITNDAWFGRTMFQRFQANALRLRAIESRTAFVRAANTGISGFVDPRGGGLHQATPLYEQAVVGYEVPLTSTVTLYDRWATSSPGPASSA